MSRTCDSERAPIPKASPPLVRVDLRHLAVVRVAKLVLMLLSFFAKRLACDIIAQSGSLSYTLPVACEVGKAYDRARLRNSMSRRSAWPSRSIPFELHFLALGYMYGTKLCCACAVDRFLWPIRFATHFLELF
jgi:hypothetical protein